MIFWCQGQLVRRLQYVQAIRLPLPPNAILTPYANAPSLKISPIYIPFISQSQPVAVAAHIRPVSPVPCKSCQCEVETVMQHKIGLPRCHEIIQGIPNLLTRRHSCHGRGTPRNRIGHVKVLNWQLERLASGFTALILVYQLHLL